jgi:hypothetical protein
VDHQEFFDTWEQYGIRIEEGKPLVALGDHLSFPLSVEHDGVQFDGGVRGQGGTAPMFRCETVEGAEPNKRFKLFCRDTFPGTWIFEGYLEKLSAGKEEGK